MWQLLVGFTVGVYIGTYYDCKPQIYTINKWVHEYIPNSKEEESEKKNKK